MKLCLFLFCSWSWCEAGQKAVNGSKSTMVRKRVKVLDGITSSRPVALGVIPSNTVWIGLRI